MNIELGLSFPIRLGLGLTILLLPNEHGVKFELAE
jgi:hypothetical protein